VRQFSRRAILFSTENLSQEEHRMKRFLLCIGLLIAATTVLSAQMGSQSDPPGGPPMGGPGGQPQGPKGPPASPAATESVTLAGKTISIAYSSPRVKGRAGHIFTADGLIGKDPHYPVWRGGANAATKLHTDADLDIAGLKVPKGDYTLFVDISDPKSWYLIVNKQTGQWGLAYDKSQDLGRTKMTMAKPPALVEDLKYTLVDKGAGKGTLTLAWENMSASVPIAAH
jgi:hypothetical protein